MNKKVTMKIGMSPVTKITTTIIEERSLIVINGGGGMGGSRQEVIGQILNHKTIDLGFMLVRETISRQTIEINPRYISTIKKVNVTEVFIEHENTNFPSLRRTVWFSHHVGTEIDFVKDGKDYPTIEDCIRYKFLGLHEIMCDNHTEMD